MLRRCLLSLCLLPGLSAAVVFDAALDSAYGDLGRAAFDFAQSDSVRLGGYAKSPTSNNVWMFGDDATDVSALYIARVLPNGQPDANFGPGNDGRRRTLLPAALTFNVEALSLEGALVQADGKPLVYGALVPFGADTGSFAGVVCRLTVAGTFDGTFGSGGCRVLRSFLSTTEQCRVTDVALAADQSLVAIGNCEAGDLAETPFITRLTSAGTLDTEFGAGAGLITPAKPLQASAHRYRAVTLRPDSQIVIAGDVVRILNDEAHHDIGVWQFDGGGSPDDSFSADGFALLAFDQGGDDVDTARDIALRPDGRIVVLGQAMIPTPDHRAALLAQLLADGAPDPAFGNAGRRIERFDTDLGPASKFNSLELDADGRLLIGGARVTGQPDATPNTGREFWISFPRSVPPEANVRIFLTSDTATSGVLDSPSQNVSIPFATTPGQTTVIELEESVQQYLDDGEITNKAVHITAQAPIVVQAFAGRGFTAEGAAHLPVDRLGRDYRLVGWDLGLGAGSEFALVAAEPGTTTVTINASTTVAGHDGGVPFQIVLQQGQMYHNSVVDPQADITGTLISADKRISVVSGHSCAQVPNMTIDFCDMAYEQMLPVTQWGTDFVTAPFAGREGGDVIRIVAHESDTQVALDGEIAATLAAGAHIDISRSNPVTIRATRPVAVAQFSKGCKVDNDDDVDESSCFGDPMMVNVLPTTAWATRHVAVVPDYTVAAYQIEEYEHYLTIVAPQSTLDNVYIDDIKFFPENFTPILGTTYSFARLQRNPGAYRIDTAEPVSVSVYGFAAAEAYGYPAAIVPLPGNEATSDDLVVRLLADGMRDRDFAPDGAALLDHAMYFGSTLPTFDGVLRAIPDGEGVLAGSATTNVETGVSSLLSYRLLDTRIFRDGFED